MRWTPCAPCAWARPRRRRDMEGSPGALSVLANSFRTEVFDGVLYVIINIIIDVFLWDLAEQSPTPKNTSCCTCLKNRGRTFEICENIDAVKKTWKNHKKQVRALYVKGCEKSPKSGLCKKDKKSMTYHDMCLRFIMRVLPLYVTPAGLTVRKCCIFSRHEVWGL